MYAPVVLFVYNRPFHTEQTLNALASNIEAVDSELYIFCDGIKIGASIEDVNNVNRVKKIVRNENRFKKVNIIIRENNIGLASSILKGVTEIINKHGRIIVLEDDIVVTKDFLFYMNKSLYIFESKKNVFHINGFNNESNLQFLLNDYYFLNFMSCWGWATWKDRWSQLNLDFNYFYDKLLIDKKSMARFNYGKTLSFDNQLEANINGEIKTWAILWYATVSFNKGLCLTPKYSLVDNIGMDGSGVHCSKNVFYNNVYKKLNTPLQDSLTKKIKYKELLRHRIHLKLFFKYGSKFKVIFIFKKIIAFLKRIKRRI
jgi:hypothetical protein